MEVLFLKQAVVPLVLKIPSRNILSALGDLAM
jgi:hypothetical protein